MYELIKELMTKAANNNNFAYATCYQGEREQFKDYKFYNLAESFASFLIAAEINSEAMQRKFEEISLIVMSENFPKFCQGESAGFAELAHLRYADLTAAREAFQADQAERAAGMSAGEYITSLRIPPQLPRRPTTEGEKFFQQTGLFTGRYNFGSMALGAMPTERSELVGVFDTLKQVVKSSEPSNLNMGYIQLVTLGEECHKNKKWCTQAPVLNSNRIEDVPAGSLKSITVTLSALVYHYHCHYKHNSKMDFLRKVTSYLLEWIDSLESVHPLQKEGARIYAQSEGFLKSVAESLNIEFEAAFPFLHCSTGAAFEAALQKDASVTEKLQGIETRKQGVGAAIPAMRQKGLVSLTVQKLNIYIEAMKMTGREIAQDFLVATKTGQWAMKEYERLDRDGLLSIGQKQTLALLTELRQAPVTQGEGSGVAATSPRA